MVKRSEKNVIAKEILFILAQEKSKKNYWTKSSLYPTVRENLQNRYNTQKVETGQRAQKVILSKDTVVSAVDTLINIGFAEIDLSMLYGDSNRLDEPVKLTFWGIMKALSSILQQNSEDKSALLEYLTDVAKVHQKEMGILFKKWGNFEAQGMLEKIVERIKKYCDEGHFTKSLVLGLRTNSYNRELKRVVSELALEEFLVFIFFEPFVHPLEKDSELWLTLITKDDELTKFVDDQFQYHLDPLFPEKELLSLQEKLFRENSKFDTDKAKIDLLHQNLRQKIDEFYKQTGYVPVFCKALKRFIYKKSKTFQADDKIDELELKEIMSLGYKAWVGLTLILMLEPTEFSILNEELALKAEKSFPFFVEKWFAQKPYNPNFAFYSRAIQAWIGFSCGMSVEYYPPRPDIWLIKGEKLFDVKSFYNREQGVSTLVLIEAEETKNWAKKVRLNKQYLEYNREGKTELDLMKNYIRSFVPKMLFVVCWEKELVHINKLGSINFRVLDGTDFNLQNLTQILKEIKTI